MESNLLTPKVHRSRSIFHNTPTITGTFNAGCLVPIFNKEVYPGDTFSLTLRSLIRMQTPKGVPMDNLYADYFFYFTPNKYLLRRESFTPSVNDGNRSWEAIMGGQDGSLNMPLVNAGLKMAGIELAPAATTKAPVKGGFWDWLGQAMFSGGTGEQVTVNPLSYLAYASIWNEEFRDPNGSMNRIFFSVNSGASGKFNGYFTFSGGPGSGTSNYFYGTGNNRYLNSFKLLPTCRFHGYFGSALPWAQRAANPVEVPLGDKAPIKAVATTSFNPNVGAVTLSVTDWDESPVTGSVDWLQSGTQSAGDLYADLANAVSASVNQIRASFAYQRWYEAAARFGNNCYADIVAGIWGVDSGVVRPGPQLLGTKRVPLAIIQVNNTGTSLGSTGSFSSTLDVSKMFNRSFTEHGMITGLCTVRHEDTLSQGIDKMFFRASLFDYPQPQLMHIGYEQISNGEIYFSGYKNADDAPFGYIEYASDMRLSQNKVAGLCRPGESLEYWNAACKFQSLPTLGDFLDASQQVAEIDRMLTVPSGTSGYQFVGQFCCDYYASRAIPTHSIPGLVDHD